MAYVATRGGEQAIEQAERLFRAELGTIDAARVATIEAALPWLVDRLMGEASLYARDLAGLALAQAGGELYEALLLLRAWRTTQPRLAVAEPVKLADTFAHRRVSAAFKDLPGGQVLGPTLDYSHRLLATEVLEGAAFSPPAVTPADIPAPARLVALTDWQKAQGLIDTPAPIPVAPDDIPDLTREPLMFPAKRAHRLQSLARADTGGTLALGYSAQRGYGAAHPTVNELRLAEADLRVRHPRGTVFSAGRVRVSSCEMIAKTVNAETKAEHLSLGFAATLGWNEVKVVAASTLDLNARPDGDRPASNEEFFLYHTEPVEASGFNIHLKLPHYVTFQSALDALRGITRGSGQARSPDDVMHEAEARTAAAAAAAVSAHPEPEPVK
ncbi:MAG: carbon-phosphorus lyase complex subunit PhnI [Tabrizicola sp.]|uniref:carbon-phosphorus lyase complex subunit PhnI n=1 Tax=Tabrizicola sp. TaxID=2005166 RepID=UPI002AB9B5C3|nr:carbon-phosphorus lyase complex subunit PhnI [Tabrizicola sp.]MDZ4085447.1 carbon-phosphorus lyase complex subunit PhnI [Tabrizicola sp.]